MYILISIIVLTIIAILAIYTGRSKKPKRLSKLATFAFLFIIAGTLFGENRLIGYSLMGVGVVLAIVDILKELKKPGVKSD